MSLEKRRTVLHRNITEERYAIKYLTGLEWTEVICLDCNREQVKESKSDSEQEFDLGFVWGGSGSTPFPAVLDRMEEHEQIFHPEHIFTNPDSNG